MYSSIRYVIDCWEMQPILRKLQVEYERYFTLRIALRTSLPKMNLQGARNIEVVERVREHACCISHQLR